MKSTSFNENTILAFNSGKINWSSRPYTDFIGAKRIGDLTDYLINPDSDDPHAEWTDECGNPVGLTNQMVSEGIGHIDMDGEYDYTWTERLGNIDRDSKEWDAIFDSNTYEAEEAQRYLMPALCIDNLEELAGYINSNADLPLDIEEVIDANNWTSDCGEEYGICHSDLERLVFNEQGKAVVLDID